VEVRPPGAGGPEDVASGRAEEGAGMLPACGRSLPSSSPEVHSSVLVDFHHLRAAAELCEAMARKVAKKAEP
jgi:hypothetical protein